MASGNGGSDVQRVLAYDPTYTPTTTSTSSDTPIAPRAMMRPIGSEPSKVDIAIGALEARQKVVDNLRGQAKALLETAHQAFLNGDSCPGDCTGMQALHAWMTRLAIESERLRIEIDQFPAGQRPPPTAV